MLRRFYHIGLHSLEGYFKLSAYYSVNTRKNWLMEEIASMKAEAGGDINVPAECDKSADKTPTSTSSGPKPNQANEGMKTGVSDCLTTNPQTTSAQAGGCVEEKTSPKPMSKRAMKRMLKRERYEAMKRGEHPKKKQKVNLNPGYEDTCLNETEYYIENGLRKVYPYYFNYTTYAKERWYGRKLFDVFSTEFRYDPPDYVKQSIQTGGMKVNGKSVDLDYVLKNGDLVSHKVHRHENHVTASPIEIIESSEDFVVINKPSSIPIHPCGRYRHNTLMFILGKEYGFKNLRTLYRLDRLTSGVFIMSYSADKIRKMMVHISQRKVTKEYLCRTEGFFPDGIIECNEPLDVISPKLGLYQVDPAGKESSTSFQRLSYNGVSSLVKCIPKTGRTHQIRVHLQYLGYPIINDPFYNHECWGPDKGKGGVYHKSREQLLEDISKLHSAQNWLESDCDSNANGKQENNQTTTPDACGATEGACGDDKTLSSTSGKGGCETTESNKNQSVLHKVEGEDNSVNDSGEEQIAGAVDTDSASETHSTTARSEGPHFDPDKYILDDSCHMCRMKYKDPTPASLVMYLHALTYKGPGWEYSTSSPEWAKDDWKM